MTDVTASCLAHKRTVHWIPAPGWWVHSDHQSCAFMWDAPSPVMAWFRIRRGDVTHLLLTRARRDLAYALKQVPR